MTDQNADFTRLKSEQKRDWDAAAAGWKKWWPIFEQAAQHVSDRLVELAGVRPGARVLDIATGTGEPAVTAARRVGATGRVIATDQSAGMLAIARERAAALGLNNLEFKESDAEALALSERDFDAVVCRWGFMFMPDIDRALTGIRSRMKPGTRLATAVWSTRDKVPMITLGTDQVRKLAGLPSPPFDALEPLRLADPSILTHALAAAGFKDVQVKRLQVVFEFAAPEALAQFRSDVAAPFRALLERQTPALRDQIIAAVTNAARAFVQPDGKLRTSNETILFCAQN
ncbi:MAG TPA: methyltransferase domain-containing protein [Candidatus Binataceae bacterium]|nr:methyltransferase domain-containing protein [Candidatus Binataceae bacterium]